MSAERAGVLHDEHLLLGADLAVSDLGELVTVSYAGEKDVREAMAEGAALADLSGSMCALAAGDGMPGLVGSALCGRELAVGEASFEGCLAGNGALVSVPLALRTGDGECVVVDPSARGAALSGWLGFLAGLEAEGGRAFPDLEIADASEMLVPLLLAGARAEEVLSDYARTEPLPGAGAVAPVHLDAIGALVARLPEPFSAPGFLVFVPPASARVLWRSLLSFNEVAPVGHAALARMWADCLPWGELLAPGTPRVVTRGQLARWGLVRDGEDFVGARALEP